MKLIISLCICALTVLSSELNIMTEEWTPYNYSKDGAVTGISTSIVKAIQEKIGNKDSIKVYPWNRAYSKLLNEKNQVLYSIVKNKSREDLFKWVGPINNNTVYFFKKKGSSLKVDNLDDAKRVKLIGAGSQTNIDYLVLKSKGFENLSKLDTKSNPISLIVNNRVDIGGSNPVTALFHLKKNNLPLDSIVNTGVEIFSNPIYIAFNINTDDVIIKKWQNALDKLKKSGEFEKIKNKAIEEAYKDFGIELNK